MKTCCYCRRENVPDGNRLYECDECRGAHTAANNARIELIATALALYHTCRNFNEDQEPLFPQLREPLIRDLCQNAARYIAANAETDRLSEMGCQEEVPW